MKALRASESLNRSSNESRNRSLNYYITTMQYGARRSRRSPLSDALAALRQYFSWRKRFAKLMPGFFDYGAAERQVHDESMKRQFDAELEQALAKVYGTSGDAPHKTENPENPKSV